MMKVELCPNSGLFDFHSTCVRLAWSTLLPTVFVFLLCVCGTVIPVLFTKVLVPVDYERYPGWFKEAVEAVSSPFRRFLTLEEAEELDVGDEADKPKPLVDEEGERDGNGFGTETDTMAFREDSKAYFRRSVIIAGLGLVETIAWLAYGSYQLVTLAPNWDQETDLDLEGDNGEEDGRGRLTRWLVLAAPFLLALTWLYTVLRAALRRAQASSSASSSSPSSPFDSNAGVQHKLPLTPPYDLFTLYCLQLITATVQLGGILWDWIVLGETRPVGIVVAVVVNYGVVVVLLGVVLSMPLAVPSKRVKRNDIGKSVSPEDYTSLFGWLTFHWIAPLINKGRSATLNEKDVWKLSPTMQSRPVFEQFARTHPGAKLLFRLWKANSLDIILDFAITLVSVVFNYAGPFFLKRILDSIDAKKPTTEGRATACIYAFLAFLCSLGKGQADLQHLWFSRRAGTRIRSELMASIYDKALKRKDFSGIVDKDRAMSGAPPPEADPAQSKKDKKQKKKDKKKKEEKKDDPKAGADVGKIVNLMAGDANRVSMTISAMYFLYGAPFEIIIASIFLYQLLGWSAFAGFFVLLLGWPLNSLIARRSIRIQKGLLAARDKRMGVLNELIGAVKFIKFFAWEDRWIDRAMDAREGEMKWMVKARVNSVLFGALWVCAPIFISVISFAAYVLQGNQLSVSIAFTSIALFNMVRAPLNVIPTWIVQILQTGVALDRIAVYLNEDEVSEQVSSLKKDGASPAPNGSSSTYKSGLGIVNASFKWNEVEEKKDDLDQNGTKTKDTSRSGSPSGDDVSTIDQPLEAETSSILSESRDHKFELKDINIMFPEGELTVVTGPTASGKTALLMALLGEMTILPNPDGTEGGQIIMSKDPFHIDSNNLSHSISYAAQTPWLRHQSIKDNVLFGYPYEEQRYLDVIEACALKPDLEMLEDGDETEIGARGVSLSGGQKARVALARAVYARTKYVLLDDPLSAVDSHTSRFLYEKLLRGPLLANRTVVLVTHHVELVLPGANYLVRMLDGRIDTHGTIKELQEQGVLDIIAHDAEVEAKKEELLVAVEAEATDPSADADADADAEGGEVKKEVGKKPRKLVKEEHRETGSVKWNIYKSYLKASSYWIWAFLFFLIFVLQVLGLAEKVWIMIWGEASGEPDQNTFHNSFKSFGAPVHGEMPLDGYVSALEHNPVASHTFFTAGQKFGINWPNALEHPLFYVGVYAAIGFLTAFTSLSSTVAQYTGALRASRTLFKQLLVTVVRATFRFHDTTPQGRMLNRFGKDIETIDSSLAGSLQAVNSSLATFFASIIAVAFVFPAFLLPAIVIGLGYREFAVGYLNTGRDLRRMESNSRSPIFSDFGELLEGIVTVRAFSAERRFLDNLHRKIDLTTQMWYSFWMTNRWLLLNFDFLGAAAVFITTLFAIATLSGGAGLAGLCITSAMSFTSSVYWACRFWTALELDLNSVERIVEYLDLPQESPAIIESNRVPAYWPSTTTDSLITVEDLEIKYAPDLPAVLHNVSFNLRPGERVGLLGRTGSGKSTLAMSLLRFVDPTSGRILIDGIDISKIGVHDLRSRLTFIPQDATLFSGTLRDNLDPFNEHTDADCLDVLQRVHMIAPTPSGSRAQSAAPSRAASIHNVEISDAASVATTATDVESKTTVSLDTQVSAGGTNFSQGQRQLIAMARALLRRSSIIILDEATSSIDFATDAKIQTTIREEFNNSLLLTVAHRLRTVIDYDRLIVLDKGEIAEFDSPWRLIQKEDGIFRTMCLKSGTFSELEAAARAKATSTGSL